MKKIIAAILLSSFILSFSANADCVRNQYGTMVCGSGQCAADQYGKAFCAAAGGGALRDGNGLVQCGVGYCARDSYARIWCSKEPGGGASVDSWGKVKCLGGCEEGSTKLCQEARE
jgi:hypothetical protein